MAVTVGEKTRHQNIAARAGELSAAGDHRLASHLADLAAWAEPDSAVVHGIRAEVYLGNPKNFGNQLKYADKRASPIAIIEGGDEKEKGVVQIKDLILGAKIAQNATLEEWKERPSQFEVPRDQLVAKVREILDGQS